jgi:hypothetical protein
MAILSLPGTNPANFLQRRFGLPCVQHPVIANSQNGLYFLRVVRGSASRGHDLLDD